MQVASGGFKIPQSVIDEKKKMFAPPKEDNNNIPTQLSQLEIYSKMGLQPYKMEDAIKDKLMQQPLTQSLYTNEHRKEIVKERIDVGDRMQKFIVVAEQPTVEEEENINKIQEEIDKHYQRLSLLEEQFMNQDLADSYQPDENVWDKIKQLRQYRNNIKKEQQESKKEYQEMKKQQNNKQQVKVIVKDNDQPKKDDFIQQQIEQFIKEKELKKNRPRSKQKYDIKPNTPEEQMYLHQFQEYKKDKQIKESIEQQAKQFEQKDFERYKLNNNSAVQINQRPVAQVHTIEELHQLQIQAYSKEQFDTLDAPSKQAIYKSLIKEKMSEKQVENEKNEQFVLSYAFKQIDKDMAGLISKGEVLEYLTTNKDIQVIFDLDIAGIQSELQKYVTHRKEMMNFTEFSEFLRNLHQDRKKLMERFKQDSKLFEQNQEQRIILAYQQPIRDLFKILDFKEEGVINRMDFVRAIRNEFSKKNGRLLSAPISSQQGSPTVNQVLEKILTDYRVSKQKKEMEQISLNQFEEYFRQSLPYEEIRLMQARIVLAHFGPGSIASEGFYHKMKNRCLLEHEQIKEILEIFMKLDKNCELIIPKRDLIEQIKEQMDTTVIATQLPKINKQYSLEQILQTIEQTIKQEEGHASNYITLQQITDYLTNFIPTQSVLELHFINDNPQINPPQDALIMNINSLYLQILNDVFDMIPRVFAFYVLKEEFIATAKNDPQSKCLLQQVGRVDPNSKKNETINQILNKIQALDIDFISWNDVLYMFSHLGSIHIDPTLKLQQKPIPQRGRKIYQQVIKGNLIEEDQFEEIENLSFDDIQMKKLQPIYEKHDKHLRISQSLKKVTVPKEPKFRERSKKTIRQQKLEEMIQEIEEKEEFELNNKFKANPLPLDMFVPQHHQRVFHQTSALVCNPPTFYERDVQKFMQRKQKAEERTQTKEKGKTFKAKEVPVECTMEMMKQKEIADQQRRKEMQEKRKIELITNTNMPKRLQEDELKRKEKKEKNKNLKASDVDPECKFNPKLNKNFVSKRDQGNKKQTPVELEYLDEDNQRMKRKASVHQVESNANEDDQNQIEEQEQEQEQTQEQEQEQFIQEKQEIPQEQQEQVQQDEGEYNQDFDNQEQDQQSETKQQQSETNKSVNKQQNKSESHKSQTKQEDNQNDQNPEESLKSQQLTQKSKKTQEKTAQQQVKKKERPKVLSSQDRELQRIEEEKIQKKEEKKKALAKVDPNYRDKIKEMEEKVNQKPMLHTYQAHGSKNMNRLRQMAKEQSVKQSEKGDNVDNPLDEVG